MATNTKLDDTPLKLMDVSKLNKLGWKAEIALQKGIETTYDWFCEYEKNRHKYKIT